jgi:hypothetical protein
VKAAVVNGWDESQAGMDLLPRFDRVAEFPGRLINHIHHCWLA